MSVREITQSVPAIPTPRETVATASSWSNPRVIAGAAGVIAVAIALVVLMGWATGVAVLRAVGPAAWASLNPMTALCLGCAGAAVLMLTRPERPRAHDIARGLAIVVAVVGVVRLLGFVFADAQGIDELLFGSAMRATGDGRTNRMAPNSAFNFALLGASLFLLAGRSRLGPVLAQLFGVVILFTAQAAVIGHLYRSGWFEMIGTLNRMALPSAIAFALLGIALLVLSSGRGLVGVILGEGPGSALARALLPAAVLVPAVLGWLVILGRRQGRIDADLGDTLLVLATMLTFVAIVAGVAAKLHESHLQRQATENALRESETRFRLITENSSDVVSVMDRDGRIVYASPSCERVLGFLPDEMMRMAPFAIVHPHDADRLRRHFNQLVRGEPVTSIECRVLHKTGRQVWLDMKWRGLANDLGEVERLQVSSRDITDRKESDQRLEETRRQLEEKKRELEEKNHLLKSLAATDALTGLRNRRAFQERLTDEVARARRHGNPLSLVLVDIDHFKSYNDTFGHPRGDEVLRNVGRLLSRMMRDTDFAARYGGEEFAVILTHTDRSGARQVAERLRRGIEQATWEERPITASLGVASLGDDAITHEELLEQADKALYRSKEQGRNRVSLASELTPTLTDS